jgi:hypothetical protein
MTRSTLTRTSLIGTAAAGLVSLAASAPAWAQANSYPPGTDCAAIQNSVSRKDCMSQMNEQRQNGTPGSVAPDTGTPVPDINTGAPLPDANSPPQNGTSQPNGTGINGNGSNGNGTGGVNGAGNGGATQ